MSSKELTRAELNEIKELYQRARKAFEEIESLRALKVILHP